MLYLHISALNLFLIEKKKKPNKAVSSLRLSACPVGCARVRMIRRSLWLRAGLDGPPLLFLLAVPGGRAHSKPLAGMKPFPASVAHLQWLFLAAPKCSPAAGHAAYRMATGGPPGTDAAAIAPAQTMGPCLPHVCSGRNTV